MVRAFPASALQHFDSRYRAAVFNLRRRLRRIGHHVFTSCRCLSRDVHRWSAYHGVPVALPGDADDAPRCSEALESRANAPLQQ